MYKVDELKALIQAFKEGGLTELDLKDRDFELTLKKECQNIAVQTVSPQVTAERIVQVEPERIAENIVKEEAVAQVIEEIPGNIVESPIVGTFYSAANPDSEPFAKIGQMVKKGDVLCIVEAMKLMNEIEAEYDGEIVEIYVENEEMVEFGQPLFKIR
ncbi:MAG: acetyl-CoA carboxylase biotin carboxyl carrier protein [Tissierellales bacterium]|jgi:acetyl-CoA carboxylase biotin carboxyl carrier protein|nr:acetyl-CoA carboxylase biotin carboxyl carrier protein [Tissierellales bacterium]